MVECVGTTLVTMVTAKVHHQTLTKIYGVLKTELAQKLFFIITVITLIEMVLLSAKYFSVKQKVVLK